MCNALREYRRAEARKVSGGYIGGVPPVPIPNTEVKPSRADGTARFPCGRVGRCRNIFPRASPPPFTGPRRGSLFLRAPCLWLRLHLCARCSGSFLSSAGATLPEPRRRVALAKRG